MFYTRNADLLCSCSLFDCLDPQKCNYQTNELNPIELPQFNIKCILIPVASSSTSLAILVNSSSTEKKNERSTVHKTVRKYICLRYLSSKSHSCIAVVVGDNCYPGEIYSSRYILSLQVLVYKMGTGDILLGVTCDGLGSCQGGVAALLDAFKKLLQKQG